MFRAATEQLGDRLRRVPDGETGPRLDWIVWRLHRFVAEPRFEMIPPGPRNYAPNPRVTVEEGVSADGFDFGALGYSEAPVSSWELSRTCRPPATFRRIGGSRSAPDAVRHRSVRSWSPASS